MNSEWLLCSGFVFVTMKVTPRALVLYLLEFRFSNCSFADKEIFNSICRWKKREDDYTLPNFKDLSKPLCYLPLPVFVGKVAVF